MCLCVYVFTVFASTTSPQQRNERVVYDVSLFRIIPETSDCSFCRGRSDLRTQKLVGLSILMGLQDKSRNPAYSYFYHLKIQ